MSQQPPKPFQKATIAAAFAALTDPGGPRRFLVADEVGLGKTVVAREIIHKLVVARADGRPPRVFYVCSSLSIARQNTERLLSGLTDDQKAAARIEVDRLGRVPELGRPRQAPFHLYALTPATSMKTRGAGVVGERVLLGHALKQVCRLSAHPWFHEALRDRVSLGAWQRKWDETSWPARAGSYLERFKHRLRRALGLGPGAHRRTMRDEVRVRLSDPDRRRDTLERLRRALILAVLDQVAPDLVIFDEFQRFFDDLVFEGEPMEEQAEQEHREHADEVLRAILEPDADICNAAEPPAVLLLSATPYRLYACRREGGQHHEELFRLLRFLFADEHEVQCAALREDFRAYRLALEGDLVGSRRALEIKRRIEERLSRVMVRTERGHLVQREPAKRTLRQSALEARDLHVFRHLCDSVRVQDRSTAEPYWSSIPYPLQMMGDDYVTSRHATRVRRSKRARLARLARKRVADYSHTDWAHPRLRALLAHLPEALLSLPWLPPTRPWWRLGPPFDAVPHPTKALVFSRFRAVPRALATLLSYEAERRAFAVAAAQERYAYFRERSAEGGKRLRPRPAEAFTFRGPEQSGAGPHNRDLLAMFLPFRALAEHGDPLALAVRTTGPMTRRQARCAARERLIEVLGAPTPHRGRKNVLAWAIALERATSGWDAFAGGVEDAVHGLEIDVLGEAVQAALRCNEPAGAPTEAELDELVELALTAPGIVLGRATRRVFGASSDERARAERLAYTALGSLRTYLDGAEWHRILKSPKGHRAAVQEAVWSGNLEAVLDEYLVLLQGFGTRKPDESSEKTVLNELNDVLGIKAVNLQVHEIGRSREPMRLRCHAALSFGLRERADEERDTLRAELVRKAFNAPFRPMVLATTSIGQEGLDFHRYCRHVVHWDLPRNPMDLEQREGRIERHGGLAVRHALAERVEVRSQPRSPWHMLSDKLFGEEEAGGLAPWWHVDGAELLRTALAPHLSEQSARLEALEDDLALYRYALGQPDQEAFVRALARRRDQSDEVAQAELERWLQDATLDLCPLPRDQRV